MDNEKYLTVSENPLSMEFRKSKVITTHSWLSFLDLPECKGMLPHIKF